MTEPKVSVAIITYNHEQYIETAVRGALNQKTDFPVEIVIADDCSADRTPQILSQLAAESDCIRLILRDQNIGAEKNFADVYARCAGEYVAFVDGDDYWIDDEKLQIQADLLDSAPELSMTFHPISAMSIDGTKEPIYPPDRKVRYTLDDLLSGNMIYACSPMTRRRYFPGYPEWKFRSRAVPGDWVHNCIVATNGPIGYVDRVMGVYRRHHLGHWNSINAVQRIQSVIDFYTNIGGLIGDDKSGVVRQQLSETEMKLASAYCRQGEVASAWAAVGRASGNLLGGVFKAPKRYALTILHVLRASFMVPFRSIVRSTK